VIGRGTSGGGGGGDRIGDGVGLGFKLELALEAFEPETVVGFRGSRVMGTWERTTEWGLLDSGS